MIDITESEARDLLLSPLLCEDAPAWSFNRLRPGLATMECGLLQADQSRAGMQVQLLFSRSPKTGIAALKFTVFQISLQAPKRVYQLHISTVARAPKNWHDMAHEHLGDARIQGNKEWLFWGFTEALDYFCYRANITFRPAVADPEAFELKS